MELSVGFKVSPAPGVSTRYEYNFSTDTTSVTYALSYGNHFEVVGVAPYFN